ncbi:MAG TPA: serine/threonine-protein phosphatase, partial [Nannocystis exedens]|nr:serine/threonine-protein phosphatase [Nannocystis exedens]
MEWGGAAGGDIASGLAVDALATALQLSSPFTSMTSVQDALIEGTRRANTKILEIAGGDPTLRGMG